MHKNYITKMTVRALGFFVIMVLISSQFQFTAEASASKRLLKMALREIQAAQPGQVVHISYALFNRMPPKNLEPTDPYHRPYVDLWSPEEVQETWIEIATDGKIARWRTLLFNKTGILLQDLMFDGTDETDYFPLEKRAYKFPMQREIYRDEQEVLLETFLKNAQASPRQTQAVDGKSVLSVYTKALSVKDPQVSIESALLSLERPFATDLKPSLVMNRIDFSAVTQLPVGDGTIVVDQSGREHLISYRTLLGQEHLTLESSKKDALFTQNIPEQAFADSMDLSLQVQTIVGLDTIANYVDYPLYVIRDEFKHENSGLTLVAASLAIPTGDYIPPSRLQGIMYAPQQGPGINTIYANPDNTMVLSIVQGRTTEMKTVLQQTMPDWMRAEQATIQFGQEQTIAWVLYSGEPQRQHYVIETSDTLLYIDAQGVSSEQSLAYLREFVLLQENSLNFKLFLPTVSGGLSS